MIRWIAAMPLVLLGFLFWSIGQLFVKIGCIVGGETTMLPVAKGMLDGLERNI